MTKDDSEAPESQDDDSDGADPEDLEQARISDEDMWMLVQYLERHPDAVPSNDPILNEQFYREHPELRPPREPL